MKKLWEKNRVLFVLIVTLIVCFITIISVSISFFYSKNVSKYGDRLENIDKHPISKKVKDNYEDKMLDNEGVDKVTITVKGRIVYVNITFDGAIDLDTAKDITIKSLDLFSKKILSYYDVEFVLTSDNFTIIGAKNAVTDHISWNNNTSIEKEEEETDEK